MCISHLAYLSCLAYQITDLPTLTSSHSKYINAKTADELHLLLPSHISNFSPERCVEADGECLVFIYVK